MDFIRSRQEYKTLYSKKKAVTQLRLDPRIKDITDTRKCLVVHTKPITPIPPSKTYKHVYASPIGEYVITIIEKQKTFHVKIRRTIKFVRLTGGKPLHHFYIRETWHRDPEADVYSAACSDHKMICWGKQVSEVKKICENKDWYWIVKRSLDLLEDGHNAYSNNIRYISYSMQYHHALTNDLSNKESLKQTLVEYINNNYGSESKKPVLARLKKWR